MNTSPSDNKYLVKISSITAGILSGGVGHILQNKAVEKMIAHPKFSKELANSFSEGVHGVYNNSKRTHVKEFLSGAFLPEHTLMNHEVHELGSKLAPTLEKLTPRQKLGLRMATQGRFPALVKAKYHLDPDVLHAAKQVQRHTGVGIHDSLMALQAHPHNAQEHAHRLEAVFKRKDLPLLSNISKNITKGHVPSGPDFVKGHPEKYRMAMGATLMTAAEPAVGVTNLAKITSTTQEFKKHNVVGAELNKALNKSMFTDNLRKGQTALKDIAFNNRKNKAYSAIVNPIPAQIHATSHALHGALHRGLEPELTRLRFQGAL